DLRRSREVAEAAQPRLVFRPQVFAPRRPGGLFRQRGENAARRRPLPIDQIVRFGGILRQVVDLRQRQGDELLAAAQQPAQRRPAAVQRRRERLEVGVRSFGGRGSEERS